MLKDRTLENFNKQLFTELTLEEASAVKGGICLKVINLEAKNPVQKDPIIMVGTTPIFMTTNISSNSSTYISKEICLDSDLTLSIWDRDFITEDSGNYDDVIIAFVNLSNASDDMKYLVGGGYTLSYSVTPD